MAWPPLTTEPVVWEPAAGFHGLTRAERSAVGGTYPAAVPLRILDLSPQVRVGVAAQAEEAVAEMRAFDAESRAETGAFAAILLRTESASSSQIEQLTASARAIAEAEVTAAGDGNAAVIAANAEAMTAALSLADHLDVEAIVEMQRALLQASAPHLVGLREEPVWIGGGGSTPLTADFVPPVHTRVRAALEDLTGFMARDDLPVLTQAAVAHAQFETIHPFADGNGRTGRAIVHAMLRAKGVTTRVTVPVSGGLLQDKDGYIEALNAYRSGEIEPIVVAFARSALRAVDHGRTMRRRLGDVQSAWKASVTARADSAVWRLLDVLITHPVLDAATAAAELQMSETNVHRHLATLVDAQVLIATKHHKGRRTLWRAPQVLEVIDQYSRDVGRRQR
jgi:Fic family protein